MERKSKVRVLPDEPVSKVEISKAKDFGKLKGRFDDARKPGFRFRLYDYRQRWILAGAILILIIILLIFNQL